MLVLATMVAMDGVQCYINDAALYVTNQWAIQWQAAFSLVSYPLRY